MKAKKFKIEYVLIVIVICLGVIVRLYKINNPIADWHSWRQADTASVTRIYVEKGLDLVHPKYYDISDRQTGKENPQGLRMAEFPVYNLFHFTLFKYVGIFNLEVWGRLVSIFSYMLSAFCIYLIGSRISNSKVGLLSVIFLTFLPYNIYYTRVILPEPLSVSLGLLSLFLFLKYLDSEKRLLIIISSIFMALALLTKPFVVFYGIVFAYLTFKKYGKEMFRNKILWLSLLIIFVPFALWRNWISNFPEGIPHYKWAFNGDGIRFRPAFWRWIMGDRLGSLILGTWGIVIFTFGFVSKRLKDFYLVFLASAFTFIMVFATANVRHDYYQIYIVPPISMILAIGSIELWKRKSKYYLSKLTLIFCLMMMFGLSWFRVVEMYKVNRPEIVKAGLFVDSHTPKDALIVAPYNNDTAFLYQTDRFGWPCITGTIEELIEKGADYYVSVSLADTDTLYVASKFETVYRNNEYILVDLNSSIN